MKYDLESTFPEPVILPSVPKDTHTPLRSVRVDSALWEAALKAAESNGESVSDVIRRALDQYVKRTERRNGGAG